MRCASEVPVPAVSDAVVASAQAMQADGWWWASPQLTNKSIRRNILKEMIRVYSSRLATQKLD